MVYVHNMYIIYTFLIDKYIKLKLTINLPCYQYGYRSTFTIKGYHAVLFYHLISVKRVRLIITKRCLLFYVTHSLIK